MACIPKQSTYKFLTEWENGFDSHIWISMCILYWGAWITGIKNLVLFCHDRLFRGHRFTTVDCIWRSGLVSKGELFLFHSMSLPKIAVGRWRPDDVFRFCRNSRRALFPASQYATQPNYSSRIVTRRSCEQSDCNRGHALFRGIGVEVNWFYFYVFV